MAEQVGGNHAQFLYGHLEALFSKKMVQDRSFVSYTGVVTDSRRVVEGNIFFAIKGEKFDGHDFLGVVAEIPNVYVVASDPEKSKVVPRRAIVPDTVVALGDLARFHRRRFQIPIVGITGSYGKTSTRAFIHTALSAKFNTLTSQGNFNNEIGLPMTLFQLGSEHEAAVLEMGMRGLGQIEYLAKIAEPTVGVITNIGPQHIEMLGSEENIARAKAELIECLPRDGLAVLPADSPFIEFLKSKAPCRIVTFGTNANSDYRVQNTRTNANGNVEFSIRTPSPKGHPTNHTIALPVPGAHNALNAAAAFAVARELGVEAEAIAEALASAELPGARMRVVKLENGTTILDDCYNAGPGSMRAALQTLLDWPGLGRRVAVLGAMKELGEHSESQHQRIGALAGTFCDVLIGVGGETRPLLNAAVVAAKQNEIELQTSYCDSAPEAASRVQEWIQNGDVVLVKGSRSVGLEVVATALRGEGEASA